MAHRPLVSFAKVYLAVPGSSPRLIATARDPPADQVDLEDAVAPDAKDEALVNVAEALARGGLAAKT